MDIINVLGKPCPIPVVEAKRALKNTMIGQEIHLLVDNDISAQNLEKMAAGMGMPCTCQNQDDGNILVTIVKTAEAAAADADKNNGFLTVVIGKNTMGEGNDELGAILLKGFIYALTELKKAPQNIVFYNSGVTLTTEGSNVITDLKTLVSKGAAILSCGTCLEFFKLKEKLAIGSVTNMYVITELMAESERIIKI